MAALNDVRFEALCNKFNTEISRYDVGDERAWNLLDTRQFEISDTIAGKEKKAKAFERVLYEMSRIFPRANTAYCQALEKQLAYLNKKDSEALMRVAQDAYMHRRGVDIMLYGKIIHSVYELSKDKKTFPYRDTAKAFRRRQLAEENRTERLYREEDLCRIDFYLEDPQTDPVKKLKLIDDAIELLQEKYFGYVNANKYKSAYCKDAVNICRTELNDLQTAKFYEAKAFEYERRADNAYLHTPEGNTAENHKRYMEKYRTDTGR